MGRHKISALVVSPKWDNSNEQKTERVKGSDYNGQYIYAWTKI